MILQPCPSALLRCSPSSSSSSSACLPTRPPPLLLLMRSGDTKGGCQPPFCLPLSFRSPQVLSLLLCTIFPPSALSPPLGGEEFIVPTMPAVLLWLAVTSKGCQHSNTVVLLDTAPLRFSGALPPACPSPQCPNQAPISPLAHAER